MKGKTNRCWFCGEPMPVPLMDWYICPKCGCSHEPDAETPPLIKIPTAGQTVTRAKLRPR